MTIKQLQQKYLTELESLYGAGEAAVMTTMVFESVANLQKQDIITKANLNLESTILINLEHALKRLQQHEPVQYIIGHAWFFNLKFWVDKGVLIPRPETEELVLDAINFLKQNKNSNVLDIGTGSGCIPISIKKNIDDASVTSIDVSADALKLAKKNAAENAVEINFLHTDFLNDKNYSDLAKFDVIISNPPYIPENEKKIMANNVAKFEPHIALFVPQHEPLLFYKKILLFAGEHLAANGRIFLEVHEDYAVQTANIFLEQNYLVNIKTDMQGKERMLIIYRCL